MGRGFAWLDTGTHDSLLGAASFISTLQKRQGLRLSCPEEVAYGQKWITTEQLLKLATLLTKNGYGRYAARQSIRDLAHAVRKSK